LHPTLCVGDVAVKFSLPFGKNTKLWFITKVCLDAFAGHIRLHNFARGN